jgi:hypothetical protein
MRAEQPLSWLRCLAPLSQPYLAAWALTLYVQQLLLRLGQQQHGGPPQVTSGFTNPPTHSPPTHSHPTHSHPTHSPSHSPSLLLTTRSA